MSEKAIVLDANILIRSVLGRQVNNLILQHAASVDFFAPDTAFVEAGKYLPRLLNKRGFDDQVSFDPLDYLRSVVRQLEPAFYADMQQPALQRIARRDADDWPVLACAMLLSCPVWTEDKDFFGTGVPTWTTDRVALYFT